MSSNSVPRAERGAISAADAYDRWHTGFGAGEDGIGAPWHELAIEQLPRLEGLRVLEIGCGRGGFARYLAERGANVVAADFSPAAVEITNRLLSDQENADAVVADIEALEFASDTFDLVISLDTIEHVPSPKTAVSELVRVAKPGGKVIITTNNYLGLIGLWRLAMKVTGFRFTEMGQPINQPLMLFPRAKLMRRAWMPRRCRGRAWALSPRPSLPVGISPARLPRASTRTHEALRHPSTGRRDEVLTATRLVLVEAKALRRRGGSPPIVRWRPASRGGESG